MFSVTSCEDTWSLFKRVQEEHMLFFAVMEVDCPRLPSNAAITVTFSKPGEELPQIILDLRAEKAFNWKSAILLHDDTLSMYNLIGVLKFFISYTRQVIKMQN